VGTTVNIAEINNLCKEISDETKQELKALGKDKRYKFVV
jgi:hypothetical protein